MVDFDTNNEIISQIDPLNTATCDSNSGYAMAIRDNITDYHDSSMWQKSTESAPSRSFFSGISWLDVRRSP